MVLGADGLALADHIAAHCAVSVRETEQQRSVLLGFFSKC